MNKGRLFIVSGPSGSGKDTILDGLFKVFPDIKFSISCITRDARKGDGDKKKYNFISREEFEKMIKNDELLEYNKYLDNYYGTPKAPIIKAIENGDDMIIEVDVNGAYNIKKVLPECVSIFILPPSLDVLKTRLESRKTETPEKITARLEQARLEIPRAKEFDYVVVNNKLEDVIKDFVNIILAEKLRTDRNLDIINKTIN